MPLWSEILKELQPDGGVPDFDGVRRKYLFKLFEHTGRDIVLYASGWQQKAHQNVPPSLTSIVDEDLHALMEVTSDLEGPNLDLILHSPGGSPEATEAIVAYLRSRFTHIRVIVPLLAMSAATMVACSADVVVMGNHSFLGPTDPQLPLETPLGLRLVPAQAALDQFDRAQRECADPAKLAAWLPMLGQYGPDLLVRCETALELSRELVQTWLASYMFRGHEDREAKATQISEWLSDHKHFKSHGRHLPREEVVRKGLIVQQLEADDEFQDLGLSVFHAATLTLAATSTTKIVESHTGRAFIKQFSAGPALGQPPERPALVR